MARVSAREKVIAVLPLLILGLGLLDLFINVLPTVPFFLVWIIGFAVVLPITAILLGAEDDENESNEAFEDRVERNVTGALNGIGRGLDRAFDDGRERGERRDRSRRRDREETTDIAGTHDDEQATRDAIETLRHRYANGDLTDEQFEAKLDRLLRTDTPENAAEWRERESDRERNLSR